MHTVDGARLRQIRQALEWSQERFALVLGVRARQVRRWEAGHQGLSWRAEDRLTWLLSQPETRKALKDAGISLAEPSTV